MKKLGGIRNLVYLLLIGVLAIAILMLANITSETSTFVEDVVLPTVTTPIIADEPKELHELYVNPVDGIEMDFPEGFVGDENGVGFGPMVEPPEAPSGYLDHQYHMRFTDVRTLEDAEASIKTDESNSDVTSGLVGNFTVVKYVGNGMCSYPRIEIIGEKRNYVFSTGCGMDDEADFAYMEKVIMTGRLLP